MDNLVGCSPGYIVELFLPRVIVSLKYIFEIYKIFIKIENDKMCMFAHKKI